MRVALLVCLCSLPVLAAERIVVLQLMPGGEGTERLVGPLTEQVLTEVQGLGFAVLGQSDLVAMLGLERQRELLSCSTDSSVCLSELSGALGAGLLLTGALSRVGETFRVDLKLIDASSGQVKRREGQVVSAAQLYSAISTLVPRLLSELEPQAPRRPSRAGPWVAGSLGAAAAIGGAVLLSVSLVDVGRINGSPGSYAYADARAHLDTDGRFATVGLAVGAVGLAAVISAVLWGLLIGPGEAPIKASLSVVPGAAGLALGGVW